MGGFVSLCESIAQFDQRFRAEGGTQQQATGLEHATETGEHRRQVFHPLQAQVAVQYVDAVVGNRQRARVSADTCKRLPPAGLLLRLAQHGQGQVQGNDLRLGPALAHVRGGMRGTTADIQHHAGLALTQVIQRLPQARTGFALQGSGGVIARGRARKRAADLAVVERRVHGRQEVA